jgi:hypothetical protein
VDETADKLNFLYSMLEVKSRQIRKVREMAHQLTLWRLYALEFRLKRSSRKISINQVLQVPGVYLVQEDYWAFLVFQ